MQSPLFEKQILLGVTGSIACYKAADLASKLTQAGALVDTVLTSAAANFISPLTFQSVTGRRAYTEEDFWGNTGHVIHIELGKSADLVVIAPCTANTIAKLAHGIADNLLTVSALAASCPVLIAPAMDGGMYNHPATQSNIELLIQRKGIVAGPVKGHLASGMVGEGRMMEPSQLVGRIRQIFGQNGPLAGRKIVVTAGGTREPIDPVRSITNRSSGKQGFALAQAAIDLGAEVVLISGPTSLDTPVGVNRVDVETAEEMKNAVFTYIDGSDALLMAAAVADFRPASQSVQKIKKGGGIPELTLVETPDILGLIGEHRRNSGWMGVAVGFAAESQDLLINARNKLSKKKLDLVVANDITAKDAGFGVDTNRVTFIFPDGRTEPLQLLSKDQVAEEVLQRVLSLLMVE